MFYLSGIVFIFDFYFVIRYFAYCYKIDGRSGIPKSVRLRIDPAGEGSWIEKSIPARDYIFFNIVTDPPTRGARKPARGRRVKMFVLLLNYWMSKDIYEEDL